MSDPPTESSQLLPTSPSSTSLPKADLALGQSPPLGDRLPYNDYTTIDWLRDLTTSSARARRLLARPGIRGSCARCFDKTQGWIAAALIGALTALVAFVVDVSVATVSDWKEGYIVYVLSALVFGIVAGSVTLTTKTHLPAVSSDTEPPREGKVMYMAAGSGIPELKTILSGFVIPHFLDLKVLLVKAVGAIFAVSTGMCLGKEGPFVHISTCVGHLVAGRFPKYAENPRKMREMLSVACSAGLSVAFGAPIGGVLFSYEEISTYFPRRVLWKAFLCSLIAAIALKALNPTGTGKLVLFETNYGVEYDPVHYLVFVLLGVCGGVFGGIFCRANFLWSKSFRKYDVVKQHPVLEVCGVVLVTALLQFPNVLIRDTGDVALSKLLVDCREPDGEWVCVQEQGDDRTPYMLWLGSGAVVKLLLTIVTFGCKVPSGIIIPALDGGALFGRLVGQMIGDISPGIFAMVGAAAFLAGVCRMTVSLAVIMFELTGEVTYIPATMCAILTAKWIADAISSESVYDLSQHLLGHPFLDTEQAYEVVKHQEATARDLIPPAATMEEITLQLGRGYRVRRDVLAEKLRRLKGRGLMDAGLVFVNKKGLLFGYMPEVELECALLVEPEAEEIDVKMGAMAELVDRTPLTISADAPMEYVLEMFGKLGPRYLIIVEPETARVLGVVLKKRLLDYLDRAKT